MMKIKFVSCMAANGNFIYRAIAEYLSQRSGIEINFIEDVSWQERELMLDRGEAHIGVICGLPYVRKIDEYRSGVELLAAPVMAAARYGGMPIYYSDIVVNTRSNYRTFADLRGARWAYNEPNSHSGHNLTLYHLALINETPDYFSLAIESGAHQHSIQMIIDETIDASAIDSTVLELELKFRPDLAERLRIIGTFGPSPIPPIVISRNLSAQIKSQLRKLFLHLHEDEVGKQILADGMMARFVEISDRDYDPIRKMSEMIAHFSSYWSKGSER